MPEPGIRGLAIPYKLRLIARRKLLASQLHFKASEGLSAVSLPGRHEFVMKCRCKLELWRCKNQLQMASESLDSCGWDPKSVCRRGKKRKKIGRSVINRSRTNKVSGQEVALNFKREGRNCYELQPIEG
jgi:hypothetical protein